MLVEGVGKVTFVNGILRLETMQINGEVRVNCEFCNVDYIFSEDHIAALFKESNSYLD